MKGKEPEFLCMTCHSKVGVSLREGGKFWLHCQECGLEIEESEAVGRFYVPREFAPEGLEAGTMEFLHGQAKLVTGDRQTSTFELLENGAVISIPNPSHLRLGSLFWSTVRNKFGLVAPIFAVKVVAGEIPESHVKVRPLSWYLDLRMKYYGE